MMKPPGEIPRYNSTRGGIDADVPDTRKRQASGGVKDIRRSGRGGGMEESS